ncbi:PstA family ABC transporter permease [Sulfuriroseicoccus oceanibius]|uniref:ABC transporter permease subunit n=1 Tax=Sulfuriroseicoccus oceanibius TaxID=2707525 RepID=A0A7T7F3T1_9BACT|nr:ABC transporter permease subunit [Sulfuriroseicoccus oceanibius]QQL46261.1 ABC transporter permease subunit [Sulfuriroseicoccus oceanibius]
MSQAPSNVPFVGRKKQGRSKELTVRGLFIAATYFILLCAAFIFGKIIYQGTPVLWQYGSHFLTRSPETLVVSEFDQSKGIRMQKEDFEVLGIYNPDFEPANLTESTETSTLEVFELAAGSHLIMDGWLSTLEEHNDDLYVNFNQRSKDTTLAIGFENDTTLVFDEATWQQIGAGVESSLELKANEPLVLENTVHDIVVPAGRTTLTKSTLTALDPTELIFIVQGIPAEDDPESTPFEVEIPSEQSLRFSDDLFEQVTDTDQPLPVASSTASEVTETRRKVIVSAGRYQLPFDLAFTIKATNPGANIGLRQSSPDGVIVADFDKPVTLVLPQNELAGFQADQPHIPLTSKGTRTTTRDLVTFDIPEPVDLSMPNRERVAMAELNDSLKIANEDTYSYSGGGVLGPLVGTALLVTLCITVALFVGISAAVFLNEYSKDGVYLKSVRLAMLNLAGVPSIIFGLFGLGLFVLLAPRLTSTPNSKDAFRIPLWPAIEQPSLRKAERDSIMIFEKGTSTSEATTAATVAGAKQFYTGRTYLSFEGWGTSILAGGLTLAIMVLPVIITSCEESLRAVPMGFREASLALGASKWQAIRTAVLPYAFPGILTASVLGITRVAGETAPIMFTAAVAARSELPWEGIGNDGLLSGIESFFFQSVQALPYHIYTVAGRIPQSEFTEPMQYGSTLLFLLVVMLFAGLSVWLRIRARKKLSW